MTRYLFLFIFSLPFFACDNSGDSDEKKAELLPPQYFYYPRANVYFDSANKDYVFSSSDTANWQTAKQIPSVVQGLMDKNVYIQNPSSPVWRDNENHKLVYSALLYATANDTTAKKAAPKQAVRSKPSIDSSKVVKKERKGLRKFLDRVFGGSKKDKEKKEKKADR